MKVLSDNTADRLLRHLAGDGTPARPMTPRAAPTTQPARMWQIHVTTGGAVTVDGGDIYADGGRFTLATSNLGTAAGNALVIWTPGTDGGSLSLSTEVPASGNFRVIGAIVQDGASHFSSRQFIGEPIVAGGSGIHFGDAEDAEVAESWSVADGTPAILDIGRAKVLVDSRGNVISWNAAAGADAGDDDEPADPEAPSPPPPCGNPLNRQDDYHPLGGGGGKDHDDDYNPLNYEGDGGFTPECGPDA